MNKLSLFVSLIIVCLFFGVVSHAFASDCISGTIISVGGNGADAIISVKNKSTCSEKVVSFCSYRMYVEPEKTGWLSTQTLFDQKTVTIDGGQTKEIRVKTDICRNQVDLFEGECLTQFTTDKSGVSGVIVGKKNTGELCEKCANECEHEGERICDGNGVKICGNFDSDSCLEWKKEKECGPFEHCQAGVCRPTCINQCSLWQHECSGSSGRICISTEMGCRIWDQFKTCDTKCTRCGDGRCDSECGENQTTCPQDCGYINPTVDIYADSGDECDEDVTLHWTSSNATNCYASNGWSGSKPLSGSETVGNFDGSRTYTITCNSNNQASATDSVTVDKNNRGDLNVDAGNDIDVYENETVRLDGSVDGDYDRVTWTCSEGELSNRNTLRPTLTLRDYNYSYNNNYNYDNYRTFTCTLTARNACKSDSDSVSIRIRYRERQIQNGYLTVQKLVRNLSTGSAYQIATTARPHETVSYQITVTANGGNLQNVFLRDGLPSGVVNPRDLTVNGNTFPGDIVSGIYVGDLQTGQSRVVTFSGTISDASTFAYGTTTMPNIVTATANGMSATAKADVYVSRAAVLAATTVSTGFSDGAYSILAALLIILALTAIWIVKNRVLAVKY